MWRPVTATSMAGTELGKCLSIPIPCDTSFTTHQCINPFSDLPQAVMSSVPSPSTSCSNLASVFPQLFRSALQTYKKTAGKDITSHPLHIELESCDSPGAVLTVLRRQIFSFGQSQVGDDSEPFAKCLIPTLNSQYPVRISRHQGVGLVITTILLQLRICALTSVIQVLSPEKVFLLELASSSRSGIFLFSLCRLFQHAENQGY